MTAISAALNAGTEALKQSSDTARLDCEVLLCEVLQQNRTYLFTWPNKTLTESQLETFNNWIAERAQGRPVAHIIGHREFWDLKLAVNPSTLIPRPDTETLIEVVLNEVTQEQSRFPIDLNGLDLGTGTGAIALALSKELPHSHWLGVDASVQAVELAKSNATSNGLDRCEFLQSDWFANIEQNSFHIIVSNPPYIDPEDEHLNQGDVRFEPKSALIADHHGLADLNYIIAESPQYLTCPGLLVLEHGYDQSGPVQHLMQKIGFQHISTKQDLAGNDRVTFGYLL